MSAIFTVQLAQIVTQAASGAFALGKAYSNDFPFQLAVNTISLRAMKYHFRLIVSFPSSAEYTPPVWPPIRLTFGTASAM
jgi:hypothetical protein